MSNKPVDLDELFPGRFLKAGTLRGRTVSLKISGVDLESLPQQDGQERKRGVVSFEGKEMQWVLNRTNATCLAAMFGRKVQDWVGRQIYLFPSTWNGDPCIRVWGSPELEAPKSVTVELPRRSPINMTMRNTVEAK